MAITYHSGERIQGLEYTAPSITLDEPFTSDNWVDSASSQFAVNTSTARLEFLDDENATGDLCYYDLENLIGSAVSTTEWLLRFKFRFSTLASGSHYYEFCMGLSDSSTANMDTGQNFIGFRCLPSSINNVFRPRVCDGGSGDSGKPRRGSSADLSQTFAINTDYFCEIKRTSASNWSISLSTTDAYDGDLQDASYTDASSSTGLRYIKIGDAVTNTTVGADMEGYIDDVEFHNGATSVVVGAGDAKPTNVPTYTRFEETDTRKIYSKTDRILPSQQWQEKGNIYNARGVFAGGMDTSGSAENTMDYITISTGGTASDFGNLTVARYGLAGCANQERGVFAGGQSSSVVIDYITIATAGVATTWGYDFGRTSSYGMYSTASDTRGIFAGGESPMSNSIDYITIATPSTSTTFGIVGTPYPLTSAGKQGGDMTDGTRGLFLGGESRLTTIDYITIDTFGTCLDWGDIASTESSGQGNISNGTIGLVSIGSSYSNRVEIKTIAISANADDYADLSTGRSNCGQCSTETRGVFAGGKTASGNSPRHYTTLTDYLAFTGGGTATDFADLTVARQVLSGVSDTGATR